MAIAGTVAIAAALALSIPASAFAAPASNGTIVWNGASDKGVAVNIDNTPSNRTNASGPKITSNAHNADFPGIYLIWDSKQKDSGYLKVDATLFDKYDSFTLTTKESNTYKDFVIEVKAGQETTTDGCYVFYIQNVANNKNINMVFVSNWVGKPPTPITKGIGFIGYYLHDGNAITTPVYWVYLQQGECIDWKEVDAAYDAWIAQGGLARAGTVYQTSGGDSKYISSDDSACYGDFTGGQLESYYQSFYMDPGYVLPGSGEETCDATTQICDSGDDAEDPGEDEPEVTPAPDPTNPPDCDKSQGDDNCQGNAPGEDEGNTEPEVTPTPIPTPTQTCNQNKGNNNCQGNNNQDQQ